MQPTLRHHNGELVMAMDGDPRFIEEWHPTVTQVRDVVLSFKITGPDWTVPLNLPDEAKLYVPHQREVDALNELGRAAVTSGRLIDFGYWPNDMMKRGADRGGPLWNQGAIGMPFSDPWLFMHQWEGGVAVYLVNPMKNDAFEVAELQPAKMKLERMLMIGDRGMFDKVEGMLPEKRYHCAVAPAALRWVQDDGLHQRANNGGSPQTAAAGNIGDPVMTALLMLNTRNVERETIRPPEKLNRARRRTGKEPYPPHDVVNSLPYVTAIMARGQRRDRSEDQGGTHRSPIAHIRMGHPRQYSSGRSIFIHDTLVNVPEEQRQAFKANRSHYTVR